MPPRAGLGRSSSDRRRDVCRAPGGTGDGSLADLHNLYAAMLHEMGHALGLGGHSPERADIMYPRVRRSAEEGLSRRDRNTLRALYTRPVGARIHGARRTR